MPGSSAPRGGTTVTSSGPTALGQFTPATCAHRLTTACVALTTSGCVLGCLSDAGSRPGTTHQAQTPAAIERSGGVHHLQPGTLLGPGGCSQVHLRCLDTGAANEPHACHNREVDARGCQHT